MAEKSPGKGKAKASGRPAAKGRPVKSASAKGTRAAADPGKGKKSPSRAKAAAAKAPAADARKAKPRASRAPRGAATVPARPLPPPVLGSTEEETIESAKYQIAAPPRRLFEEERFIFPESYGVNRIRLLVKDPDWLFVHWDVAPESMSELRSAVGERTVAMSKLTLRISDPGNGGTSVVLLPPGVRSWYVRADSTRRAYKAELGLTLPSGEFRRLAESNTVVTPRVGPSPERARRVLLYKQAQMIPSDVALAVGAEEVRSAEVAAATAGPWSPVQERQAPDAPGPGGAWGDEPSRPGGASDTFRPGGASDVHRR